MAPSYLEEAIPDQLICGQCGHDNRAEARFCASCGAPLVAASMEMQVLRAASETPLAPAAALTDPPPDLAGYRPLARRALWVQGIFVTLILASVLAIGFDGAEIALLDQVIAGEYVTDAELEASDSRQMVVGLLVIALWVGAAVVFIRWFHAAYRNLRAFGLELRFRPGWSIGAWFVPFLNFWRPKQIANDIWRGSDPVLPKHLDPWSRPIPTLLGLWWAAWIIGLFVSRGAFSSSLSATTPAEFRTAAIVDIVGLSIDVTAAVLAILFVRRATARQGARVAQAQALGTTVPDPRAA